MEVGSYTALEKQVRRNKHVSQEQPGHRLASTMKPPYFPPFPDKSAGLTVSSERSECRDLVRDEEQTAQG